METRAGFLSSLGWEVVTPRKTRLLFNNSFVSLGVLVDLRGLQKVAVVVKDKPGKTEAICADAREVLRRRVLDSRVAFPLKGKVGYA